MCVKLWYYTESVNTRFMQWNGLFLTFNLEKFTPVRKIYTGGGRRARDNYEVCLYALDITYNVADISGGDHDEKENGPNHLQKE